MRFQVNQELQKASFCKNNSKKSPPCVGQRTFVLVLHPLSIATRLALQVGCGSLTIMGDKEYQQKLERNQQAFEAWVEKKAAELKVQLTELFYVYHLDLSERALRSHQG